MPHYPQPVVVFDCDGTLVDTLPATVDCFRNAVAPYVDRTPTRDEVVARFGPADHDIVREWVGPDRAEEAVARLYACYEQVFASTRPFPGILDLMRALRDRGRRIGLFTGRGRPSTDRLLASSGLVSWIEASVTGDEVPHSKPAPDGLLVMANAFAVSPADLVYVGDSPLDLQAANAAGASFLGVAWARGTEPITDPRATVLTSVEALSKLLLHDR